MSDEKYDQILKILEANDCYCTDDETDREVLAKVLKDSLFPKREMVSLNLVGVLLLYEE